MDEAGLYVAKGDEDICGVKRYEGKSFKNRIRPVQTAEAESKGAIWLLYIASIQATYIFSPFFFFWPLSRSLLSFWELKNARSLSK